MQLSALKPSSNLAARVGRWSAQPAGLCGRHPERYQTVSA
jgi:hypothetical protein